MAMLTPTPQVYNGPPTGIPRGGGMRRYDDPGNAPPQPQGQPTPPAPQQPPAQTPVQPGYVAPPPMQLPGQVSGVPIITPYTAPNAPSTSDITSSIMAMLGPLFQQQQGALNYSLASNGIVGGPTAAADTGLAKQQSTQALGDMAPYLMQGLQMQQAVNFANQNAGNTAQSENQQTALQGGEFNATSQNQASQFDISNLIKNAMENAGIYNNFLGMGLGFQNQDWLAKLGAQTQLNAGAAGGQTGAFQPVFQQPAPINFGGIGAGLAPTPTSTPPPPSVPPGYAWA